MKKTRKSFYWYGVILACCFVGSILFFHSPLSAQNIVEEWSAVKVPAKPELKSVTVDAKATALLMLDFNKQTCNEERRPRCIASIPKVKKLLTEARARGVYVIFSLSPGAVVTDIAKELAPLAGEPIVTSGPDKFLGTDLEKILKEKGIKTVIAVGTAAHGAVLYTASGATLRGMQAIVPVDGMSAESTYPEQYVAWHMVNAPRVSALTVLTTMDLIEY